MADANRKGCRLQINTNNSMTYREVPGCLSWERNELVIRIQRVAAAARRIGRNACQRNYFSSALILMLASRAPGCLSGDGFVASAQVLRQLARSTDLFRLSRGRDRAGGGFCHLTSPSGGPDDMARAGVISTPGAVTKRLLPHVPDHVVRARDKQSAIIGLACGRGGLGR